MNQVDHDGPVLSFGQKPQRAEIEHCARRAIGRIAAAIQRNPGTGQTRRLVRFVAGCYNGSDFPFDLAELRGLDAPLAEACIQYLNFDRLGIREIHHELPGGERALHQWLRAYGLLDESSRKT